MKTNLSLLRSRACSAALVIVSLALVLPAAPLAAQAQRGPAQRVVQGKVVDKANSIVKGAVVYLKDTRSLAVKSFFSNDQGEYRFSQLAQNIDYELWAEKDGKKSATKTISSFDNRNNFQIILKIE